MTLSEQELFSQTRTGAEGIKLFSCSTQLSTKFILFINVKMPTIIGILTLISMINTTSSRLKARNFFICQYFSFYEQLKFCAKLIEHENFFIISGPGCTNKISPNEYLFCILYKFEILKLRDDKQVAWHKLE